MSAAYTFFLRWLEMRGAAVEQGPDAALVLLPPGLLDLLGFPETLAVTADPDVAAEDGALLLTPGHPALERGVHEVLRAWTGCPGPVPCPPRRRPC